MTLALSSLKSRLLMSLCASWMLYFELSMFLITVMSTELSLLIFTNILLIQFYCFHCSLLPLSSRPRCHWNWTSSRFPLFAQYFQRSILLMQSTWPQWVTMGSGGLPIPVNRAVLVLFFILTALTLAIKLSTSVK